MKLNILNSTLKSLFLVLFLVLGAQYVEAQTISHNQNGEKIVLYNDGSWRYFDENDPDDIALLGETDKSSKIKKSKSTKPKKSKKGKNSKVAKIKSPKTKKGKRSKGEKQVAKRPKTKKPKKDKASNKRYAKSKTKKPRKDKASKKLYTKSKTTKKKADSGYTSVTSGQNYKRIINKEIIDIRDKQNMAYEKERIANFATQKYERELATAKKRKLDKNKLKSIDAKRKEAKLRLKLARNQNKVLLKQRRSYEAILRKNPNQYAVEYSKLANKYNKDFESVPTIDDGQIVVSDASRIQKTTKKSKTLRKQNGGKSSNRKNAKRKTTVSRDSYDDFAGSTKRGAGAYQVSYPSTKPNVAKAATPDCNIVFQGQDSFSGKRRTDLGKSSFFSFTSDKMRPYFEEGDMIECEAYMSAVAGGYKFICIEVTVSSETAQRSYGSIEKQGLLSVKLVDGTTVNLYNNKTDSGFLDPLKKQVLYKAQYLIPSEHVKTLSKVDIDMVRLVWSTGYEDYTIYETDFLINQLDCLSK